MRKRFVSFYRRWLFRRVGRSTIRDDSSAVVFAPHPDDETLACGGTICRKRDDGADVTVVVMTDGRESHGNLLEPDALIRMRALEAQAATGMLGVLPDRLHLLGFPDGELDSFAADAAVKAGKILIDRAPQEIYIPCRWDKTPDHIATNAIVMRAVSETGYAGRIYEYPVWFWMQWPFCKPEAQPGDQGVRLLLSALKSNVRLLYSFSVCNPIDSVFSRKQSALREYRSQLTRVDNDSRWPTLGDVSEGGFLECFLQPYEVFCEAAKPRAGKG